MSPNRSATYFRRLAGRLRPGTRTFSETCAEGHARFILSAQGTDGGFRGRRGGSDLYYTAFAARALAILGRLGQPVARSAAAFLESCPASSVVDLVSWLSTAEEIETVLGKSGDSMPGARSRGGDNRSMPSPEFLREVVEAARTPDGGYARAPNAVLGSTYQTFLAVLCYDLAGAEPPFAGQIAAFVAGRRREDGGFAETAAAGRSGTNATAAGVALALLTGTPAAELAGAADLLLSLQASDGGWAATRHAPMGDLLSTFTALVTLSDLGSIDRADLAGAAAFVRACAHPAGGYRGVVADDVADVEYAFYGIAAAALLERSNQQSATTKTLAPDLGVPPVVFNRWHATD